MKQHTLTVNSRDTFGRGASKRLRAAGEVPAVIYGKHTEPVSIKVDTKGFQHLLKETAGSAALIQLKRDGKESTLSIIQEVQKDPVSNRILHIDFQEVSAREKMDTHVAVHMAGEAIGVKTQNGNLEVILHQIDIRCLPNDLPGFVEVDVSDLEVGQSIHVSDLPELPGVEYLADRDQVVVSCSEQRVDDLPEPGEEAAEKEETEEEAEAEEGEEETAEAEKKAD